MTEIDLSDVPDEEWESWKAAAAERGQTLGEFMSWAFQSALDPNELEGLVRRGGLSSLEIEVFEEDEE